jgi:Periplasmic component of the Tol biopolymer transport system
MMRRARWFGALALSLAVGACSKDETPPPPKMGDGTVRAVATVVSGGTAFRLPFDAALSPDGKTAYFTALVDEGAALFKSPATGGPPTKLADLVGLGSVEVTSDGSTVLVGDPATEPSPGALGAIVAVPSSGGTPSVLTGTEGSLPQGIAIAGRRVVFSGVDPADGVPGVFETSASGGLSVVLKAGLIDPSGVTVASSGEVYVLDAESDSASTRRILRIASGSATELVKGLRVGYPAGIALAENGLYLVVASTDPVTGTARFERFGLSGTAAGAPVEMTIGSFDEPAGLHRAAGTDRYAYVDSGANGTGTVFVVNPQ